MKNEIEQLRQQLEQRDSVALKLRSRLDALQTQHQLAMDAQEEKENRAINQSQLQRQMGCLQERYLDLEEVLQVKQSRLDNMEYERDKMKKELKKFRENMADESFQKQKAARGADAKPQPARGEQIRHSIRKKNEVLSEIKQLLTGYAGSKRSLSRDTDD